LTVALWEIGISICLQVKRRKAIALQRSAVPRQGGDDVLVLRPSAFVAKGRRYVLRSLLYFFA